MDYSCWFGLLGNSFTASGGDTWPELLLHHWNLFFHARCTFIPYLLFSSYYRLCLSHFICAVLMCKCLGEYSCMSSTFPIVILNCPQFFLLDEMVLAVSWSFAFQKLQVQVFMRALVHEYHISYCHTEWSFTFFVIPGEDGWFFFYC